MKKIAGILVILVFCNICLGQKREPDRQANQALGQYWFVMYYKTGKSNLDSATRIKLTGNHINYILGLRKKGKIITGGAFTDQVAWLGFQVYNCKTKEEVIKLTEEDPLISSKMATYEIHPWVTLKDTVTFN